MNARERFSLNIDGRVLGETEVTPIHDGDTLRFDGVECRFVLRAPPQQHA